MANDFDNLWDWSDPASSQLRFQAAADAAEPTQRLLLLTQVARALGLQDRFDAGHAVLDELPTPDGSPEGVEVSVRTELERGRLLRSAGHADQARPHFEDAARMAADSGLELLHVDVLHMLALDVPPEEAVARNLKALDVARAATDPRARDWDASLLNNLGMAWHDLGDLDRALSAFEEALVARTRIGAPRETRIAKWMVAWTFRLLGRHDEALAWQTALKAELAAAGEEDPFVDEEIALLAGPGQPPT